MTKKRDRLEIIFDILRAIQDKGRPMKPTHILYKSNLSHQMLRDYISELLEKGLVSEESVRRSKSYYLTDKGLHFLKDYKSMREFLDSYGIF